MKDIGIGSGNYVIPLGKNITFDLNGKTVNTYAKENTFINNGTFKVADLSEEATANQAEATN